MHVSEENLEDYALGKLSPGDSKQLEEHLVACRECRDNFRRHEAFLDALWAAIQRTRPRGKP